MIQLQNITKSYHLWWNELQVLKWIDLEINDWDFVSIMWPSWSWKSTLMNIIGLLDIPTTGNYMLNSEKITWFSEDRLARIRGKNIGFIFQSYNLISRTSVLKQVMLPLAYQWVWKSERKKIAIDALKKVWLEDKIDSKPNELSGWQQQRVSIARALAINPTMILADEPTWALDSTTWKEIMELLKKLNWEWTTIVLITHEKEIDSFAKKHIRIKDGLIV
jgi:putative ABC transport system ATP-binding protein